MLRKLKPARPEWKKKVEDLGFNYHTLNNEIYWDERAYYEFSLEQVEVLEKASDELYLMCIKAAEHVIKNKLFSRFHIPDQFIPMIQSGWDLSSPSIYGRFDLSWSGDPGLPPKMLEFNADTPTSLFEASVVQWQWLQDCFPEQDQFNSIHEKIIHCWKKIKPRLNKQALYFSCLSGFPEDIANLSYIQDCSERAGIRSKFIGVADIGWNGNCFTDLEEKKIFNIFKLYPWEWLMSEEFGPQLIKSDTLWIEPAWKMILSNKAILPILWELFPGHPYLLESYYDEPGKMINYIKKPLLSREGANVTLVENNRIIHQTGGDYGEEGFIYQQLCKLPDFNNNYPVLGSWLIGGQAAGLGIRESNSPITDNYSRFLPHIIRENFA
jgi:glutathionylspermidine synthase